MFSLKNEGDYEWRTGHEAQDELAVAGIAGGALIAGAWLGLAVAASGHLKQSLGHSESYQQGYSTAHDYYSIPKNRDSFQDDVQNGYNVDIDCRMSMALGPHPSNEDDWMHGCVDAMHDLGLKP